MSKLAEFIQEMNNITNQAETSMKHAEDTVEIIGVTLVILLVICILGYLMKIICMVKNCICWFKPRGYSQV